jgi:anti-sigma-K factor RskA/putative zinc finger protein
MNVQPMSHADALDLAAGYVLGALEPAEQAAVRHHLGTCPESHAEFEELGGVVPALLELDESELVEPPPALRERIIAAARADLAARGAGARSESSPAAAVPAPTAAAPARPALTAFPSASERDARRASRTRRLDWALRIAAVIAIVAVGAWGLGLQRQLDSASRFDQAVATVLDAAARPGAQAVILTPAAGKQGRGIAAVAADGTVTLAMRDLSATNDGQVYTAWVIVGQNAPIPVSDFTVDANGTASVTTRPAATPAGAIIALTLEPNAGNNAPKGPIISTGVTRTPPGSSS